MPRAEGFHRVSLLGVTSDKGGLGVRILEGVDMEGLAWPGGCTDGSARCPGRDGTAPPVLEEIGAARSLVGVTAGAC